MEHSNRVPIMPSGGPWSTGPGEAQKETGIPKAGEAQVGTTVTRSRVVSGADQNDQVHMMSMWERESPVTGEDPVGIRLTMSR